MLDRALLGFTPLRCAMLGYNFAGLCWTLLNYTTLDNSKLICTELDSALLGYNFALLYYAPLRYDTVLFAQLCYVGI
jgi:hypothetical protein